MLSRKLRWAMKPRFNVRPGYRAGWRAYFRVLPVALVCSLACVPVSASARTHGSASDLAELSLEQLGQVVVTSVSRRPQQLGSAAASIYVISREDIRRAGATTLPEALRLAPNLQVARADANQYAITARGTNAVLANKLLVMIDGRTIYTPLFSGVFWEAQHVLLTDVDRIEVISGPGATLWGANAVNGVINVITRSAQATPGAMVEGYAGDAERGAALRYGGDVGQADAAYRVYATARKRDASHLENGVSIRDASRFGQLGLRADFAVNRDLVMLDAAAYQGESDMVPEERDYSGAHFLARLSRYLEGGASLNVQGYVDRTHRRQFNFEETLDTVDLAFQHGLQPLGRHQLLWGAGYRWSVSRVTNSPALAFFPARRTMTWSNLFVQDDISLSDQLTATLGAKVERNVWTGGEFLPNARLAWQVSTDDLFWGALSRAVRAPSRVDREFFVPGTPPFFLVAGGPNFQSEIANVAELGYRGQVTARLTWSITGYHHDFKRLRSVEQRPAGPQLENQIEGRARGVETWAEYRMAERWRVSGGLVVQDVEFRRLPGSTDTSGLASSGNDPDSWWTLRLSGDPWRDVEVDLLARRVGALPNPAVPSYAALDARIGWRPSRNWELSLVVRNALDAGHVEWGVAGNRSEVGREWLVKAVWHP